MDETRNEQIRSEQVQNRINALKADVYELIKQQEILVLQSNQLQEAKLRKVQEITTLESLHKDIPKMI